MSSVVHVALSDRAYDIFIGATIADRLDDALRGCLRGSEDRISHAVLITDANVASLHAQPLQTAMAAHINKVDLITVEAGEQTKSLRQFEQLCEQVLALGADRHSLVVACGGGVVGDLAGFVAASFARGIRFLQVPTTLLAQVDSSVGGKTGVNLPGAKNMVGAFWQPSAVLIGVAELNTLPDRDYRAGLAEVVKYGVILDEEFFEYLEDNVDDINRRDPQVLEHIVTRCCRLKADVVEGDEREETGLRAVLNYGHTFCHAIEAETHYGAYLHGEAVAIGMLCASRLADQLGRIDPSITKRQQQLLQRLQLPITSPGLDPQQLMAAMMRDKKVAHGKLRLVLPTRLGHVELVSDVSEAEIKKAWLPAL